MALLIARQTNECGWPINPIDPPTLDRDRDRPLLPLTDGGRARLGLAPPDAHAVAVVDAQDDGEEQRQQQAVGGEVAVGDVAALEAVERALAVQHAAAIGVRAGIEHVLPVCPGHRRGDAADQRGNDGQRVE